MSGCAAAAGRDDKRGKENGVPARHRVIIDMALAKSMPAAFVAFASVSMALGADVDLHGFGPRSLAFEVIRGSRHPSEGAADASDRGRRRDPRTRVRPQKATSNQARSRRLIANPASATLSLGPILLLPSRSTGGRRLQRVGHGITAMISLRKSAPVHVRYGYRRVHFALPREGWNWACNRETGRRSGL